MARSLSAMFFPPCWLSASSLLHSRLSRHCAAWDVEVYVNFSSSLSICPSLCQVVGADAVTTVWSWQALVDAVKCSRGKNTSEGRNEKWGVEKKKKRTQHRNTIWASQREREEPDGPLRSEDTVMGREESIAATSVVYSTAAEWVWFTGLWIPSQPVCDRKRDHCGWRERDTDGEREFRWYYWWVNRG